MWLLIALMASIWSHSPASAPRPAADPEVEARAQIRSLVAGIQQIERIRAKTPPGALDAGCVDEKLAEARAGLQIAGAELGHVRQSTGPDAAADRDYALRRLRLLVERADGLTHAARVCATEELSTVDTTKVEVEISPSVPGGDWTSPPSVFQLPQRPPQQ